MIKSLQLVDFKPFRDTGKIKLGSLNILAGTNGKGKSSLLQGLLLLSQSIRQSEQHIPDNLQINGDYVNLGSFDDLINTNAGSKSFQFHLVTDSENDNDFLMSYTKIDGEDEWGRLFSLKVNGIEKFSNAGFYIDEGGENQAPEIIAPAFSGYTSLIRIQKLYYVAAAREASRGEEELVPASKHIHLDCQGRNVLNVMYKQGPDFCRMLEEQMSLIFDGASFSIRNDGKSVRLYMDSIDKGRNFHPVNVGYGFSYILTLLVAGLLAQKDEIIIVENPEAHLHPSAQAAVMRFFCELVIQRGVQIFIETHSDHIVNASLLAVRNGNLDSELLEIMFFSRNAGDVDINIRNLEISSKGRVKNPPKNFCDQYAMDLRALMGM